MTHIACLLLALVLTALTLAACSGSDKSGSEKSASEKPAASKTDKSDGHPHYIRAEKDETVIANFFPKNGDAVASFETEKLKDEDESAIYVCYADTSVYDRVTVTIGERESDRLAFNDYTSGWELSPGRELPFTYDKESTMPQFDRKEFPYQERNKGIEIWTPADYDPKSPEKYSVIYMTDAQNLYHPNATSTGSWAVAESAEAMMSQSDNKVIIVGIENMDGWRDDELTPNLGAPTDESYADGHGEYFCDFVVNTVMPYIEENYNVYTDREHTAVCGSSSGGIESFYIAMEHPEKFGTVGALSPAFDLFDNDTWKAYLETKDFSAGYPRIYLYCGRGDDLEKVLYAGFESMPDNLASIAYPAENITCDAYETAVHSELYWRIVFPDFLRYLFP